MHLKIIHHLKSIGFESGAVNMYTHKEDSSKNYVCVVW